MGREHRARRRGKVLEEAIYQAVWDELHEVGFAKLTVDGVARRAGTSKPVLYRRWPGRSAMMVATIHHFLPEPETFPDNGSLRADTLAVLRKLRGRLLSVRREVMIGILQEVVAAPEENKVMFQAMLDHLHDVMIDIVFTRAIERGEITADQMTDRLVILPLDLARIEFLLTGDLPDSSLEEIVDQVFLPALAARATAEA